MVDCSNLKSNLFRILPITPLPKPMLSKATAIRSCRAFVAYLLITNFFLKVSHYLRHQIFCKTLKTPIQLLHLASSTKGVAQTVNFIVFEKVYFLFSSF